MGWVPSEQRDTVQESLGHETFLSVGIDGDIAEPLAELLTLAIEKQGQVSELRRVDFKHFVKHQMLRR